MASKLFLLTLFCIVATCSGFSISRELIHNVAETFLTEVAKENSLRLDYGPSVAEKVLEIIQALPPSLVLFEEKTLLNLTELSQNFLNNSLIKGESTFWDFTVDALPTTEIPVCSIVMNGIIQPLTVDVSLTNPTLVFRGMYNTEALYLGIIPIRGEGNFNIAVNLTASVQAAVKLLGNPLTLTSFEYFIGDLKNINIQIDGLLGDAALNDVVVSFVKTLIPKVEEGAHATLVETVKSVFLSLDLTLNDILDLLNPTTTTLATTSTSTTTTTTTESPTTSTSTTTTTTTESPISESWE